MNIFTKYLNYLNDNPQGLWFKRKLYGWGWTPATWQGWAVIGIFLVSIMLDSFMLDASAEPSTTQMTLFFAKITLSVAALLLILLQNRRKTKMAMGFEKIVIVRQKPSAAMVF